MPVTLCCLHCAQSFDIHPCEAKNRKRRYCSLACRKAVAASKQISCAHCQTMFHVEDHEAKKGRKFCSMACVSASKSVMMTCEYCGEPFHRPVSTFKRSHFCSLECSRASKKKLVTLVCPQCSISFQRKPSIAKQSSFCSRKCRDTSRTTRVVLACKQCGVLFPCKLSHAKRIKFCSNACQGIAKRHLGTAIEKARAIQDRRRARKNQAAINDLTEAQWLEIKAAYDYRCVYCPLDCKACKTKTHKLTKDHLTSFYKHGNHTVHNVLPACKSCNCKKYTGPVPVPVQPLLLTIAPAKPARTRKKRERL